MKLVANALIIAAALIINPLFAATYTYEAVTDFTDIEAGEVPYYRHNGINALAINAADESYRDRFARATLEFKQNTALYDVTITALGETDGDGEFRFLVNGVVVGSAINAPASVDYGEQLHTFENINIPAGAIIGVESISVSNGKIPEGDAFAYARGRWTQLTLSDVDTGGATPDPVENIDLKVSVSADKSTALPDDTLNYSVTVENLSGTLATNPSVAISFSDGITNVNSDICSDHASGKMTCVLPEIAGNQQTSFTVSAVAGAQTDYNHWITADVIADQLDTDASNDTASVSLQIQQPSPADDSVDLDVTVSADKDSPQVGDTIGYTVLVSNLHDNNTATSPAVGIVLPESLRFNTSANCTAEAQVVTCMLEELPPGAKSEAAFSASAVSVNSYSQLLATASSSQPESITTNNEAQIITDISAANAPVTTTTDQSEEQGTTTEQTPTSTTPASTTPTTTTSTTTETAAKSGGGSIQAATLLLLLLAGLFKRFQRQRIQTIRFSR